MKPSNTTSDKFKTVNVFKKKIELTLSAKIVLEKRYLIRDFAGKPIEAPEDMFRRVAYYIAEAEKVYDKNADVDFWAGKFYELMVDRDFLPNSPTLMNAGRELGQLSACFVLPVDDSMESIFETLKHTALIHKSGGGTGFSFSRLRPKNDCVHSTVGISSGPVSFMRVYDSATETIKQGGTRRGANMAILRIDHPDIEEFITCKRASRSFNNFNISVAITEKFMEAVENDSEIDLVNPRDGNVVKKVRATALFDMIVESAWASAEPGIIFIDRINRDNPTPNLGEIESTNPCGEQPLLPYESCNLGSINLSNFVENGKINFEHLGNVVDLAVRFLDNVIEMNNFPLPQIKEQTLKTRKIGLGVMGFAEMLFKLGIPYDSNESEKCAGKVMSFIQRRGREMSMKLAEERGEFPAFKGSIYDGGPKVRNATVTTIAPTGTISIIAGTTSGIEPIFALAFARNVLGGERLVDVNPVFIQELEKRRLYSDDLVDEICNRGSLREIENIPEDMKRIFVVAHDIDPEWHIRIQSAFQKYTDNAVSKTINYPNSATQGDIRAGYLLAYKLGCKGVTVYRDGSRDEQVLTMGIGKKEDKFAGTAIFEHRQVRKRPPIIRGMTYKVSTGCGNFYITINEDEHGPFELFAHLGKSGGCPASQSEAISRLISLMLRSGVPPEEVIKQLSGIRCPSPMWDRGEKILSCPDAIGRALQWYLEMWKSKTQPELPLGVSKGDDEDREIPSMPVMQTASEQPSFGEEVKGNGFIFCPECGSRMVISEGCAVCPQCGYSKCD